MWYCAHCGYEADAGGSCPRDALPLGRVSARDLFGHKLGGYTVLARIGGGSYGDVYRAIHARSGMTVAIKLLRQPIDEHDGQRVIVEARAAATIHHPCVVQVYDLALTTDRRPYIVMQYLDPPAPGASLGSWCLGKLPLARAVAIASDVLRGLAAAHARGVVHRDLKPDNICVRGDRAVLVDFGLAKLIADPNAPHLTLTGESVGTPRYMAPEQIRGHAIDARADLYALGVVLYEALAGAPPFPDSAPFALFDAHLHRPPPPLAAARPDLPTAVIRAVERALAKDPAARFADADAMRRALVAAATPGRRARWPYIAAGGLAIATLAVVIVATTAGAGPAPPPPASSPPISSPPAVGAALPAPFEANLRELERLLASHTYNRTVATELGCVTARMLARIPPRDQGGDSARYLRRLLALVVTYYPDLDLAHACR